MGIICSSGGGGRADLDVVTATAENVEAGKVIVGPDGEPITGVLPVYNAGQQALSSGMNTGANHYFMNIPYGSYKKGGSEPNGSWVHVTLDKLRQDIGATNRALWLPSATIAGQAGTMPVQGGSTNVPTTAQKLIVSANRYVNGNIYMAGDANFTEANIKKGVTMWGKTGQFEGYVAVATDLYYRGNNPSGISRKDDYTIYYTVSFTTDHIQIAVEEDVSTAVSGVCFGTNSSYNLTGYTGIIIRARVDRTRTGSGNGFYVGYGGVGDYGRPKTIIGRGRIDMSTAGNEMDYYIPFDAGSHSLTTQLYVGLGETIMEFPQTIYIYQIRLY